MLKEKQMYSLLKIGLVFAALEGYSIKFIPLPWLGSVFFVILGFLSIPKLCKTVPPYLKISIVFFIWAVVITLVNISGEYAVLMPGRATTPYPLFITLRFLELAVFVIVFWVVYRLCISGYRESLIRFTAFLGIVLAVTAIYFYLAQIFNFYYPAPTRMTTGGQMLLHGDTVRYTYAFHRAAGIFREPSHLAEWLIIPLFLAVTMKINIFMIFAVAVLLATIFLTGSLTAILATGTGFLISVLFYSPYKVRNSKIIAVLGSVFLISLILFRFIVCYSDINASLYSVLQSRIAAILAEGTAGTNRAYIYDYFLKNPPSFWGVGLGHGNILFSKALNSEFMASYLNLFIYFAYNLGIIGLGILFLMLFMPLFKLIKNRCEETRWLVGAYCAWIVVFIGRSETLAPIFGVLYGMVLFHARFKGNINGKKALQDTDCHV